MNALANPGQAALEILNPLLEFIEEYIAALLSLVVIYWVFLAMLGRFAHILGLGLTLLTLIKVLGM